MHDHHATVRIDPRTFRGELKVGMLGGGQLGRMVIQAGLPFNLAIDVLDPSPDAPCRHYCHRFVTGDFKDYDAVLAFGRTVDVLTIEIEHVNVAALEQLEREGIEVSPSAGLIRVVQDKGLQKDMFARHGIPTAPFVLCDGLADVAQHLDRLPAAMKLRTGGYDGRGVALIDRENYRQRGFDAPSVLEAKVEIARELSFIVARSKTGEMRCYPPVEMVFDPELNLVDHLVSPARIDAALTEEGQRIAMRLATELELVGLLAVETFLAEDGALLVNEIAPRPHNSGHHTIEGNVTSQFEQHLRAILGLPLGNPEIVAPAVMLNLIGDAGYQGTPIYEGMTALLATHGAHPHLYGKAMTKPGRKMGHITIVGSDLDDALAKASTIKSEIGVRA